MSTSFICATVYRNSDHELDIDVYNELIAGKLDKVAHTAWNFCAYVTYADNKFTSIVFRYGNEAATFTDKEIMSVISKANDEFGSE